VSDTRIEDRIDQYQIRLIVMSAGTCNEKELHLIDTLAGLLDQAKEGLPLDVEELAKISYKTSHVPCFGERYYEFVEFLQSYQKRNQNEPSTPPRGSRKQTRNYSGV